MQSAVLQIGKEAPKLSQDAATRSLNGAEPSSDEETWMAAFRRHGLEWLDPTKRRALTALMIRVAGAAIAYVMQIVLAQWLGLAEYGVFVGVWVWLLVLGGIAPLGFNISAIGLLSTYKGAGDFDRWRGLLVASVAMAVGAGLLLSGIGWVALYAMPGLVSSQYLMPVWLCLFCLPLMALGDINEGVAREHGWMNAALVPIYLLRPILLIGGLFIAMLAGATPDAALAMAMAMAIMACLVAVLMQAAVIVIGLKKIAGWGALSMTPGIWLYGALPIVVVQTFELIMQNFDMLAISYFLGAEATGIYFSALKTIALLTFVNFAVGAATANQVASLHANDQRVELGELISGAINLSFWPTLFGALVIVLLAPFLLSLFGDDFVAHAYLTAVLAIGFVAKSFVGPAELYLNVLGQQKICALVFLVAAVLNMLLNIILIPLFGLLGAAIATSTALVGLSVGLFFITKQRIGVTLCPTVPITSLKKIARCLQPSA